VVVYEAYIADITARVRSATVCVVINLKSAKALGLAVPNSMQLLADEAIRSATTP
jgi:hypothetical protein